MEVSLEVAAAKIAKHIVTLATSGLGVFGVLEMAKNLGAQIRMSCENTSETEKICNYEVDANTMSMLAVDLAKTMSMKFARCSCWGGGEMFALSVKGTLSYYEAADKPTFEELRHVVSLKALTELNQLLKTADAPTE